MTSSPLGRDGEVRVEAWGIPPGKGPPVLDTTAPAPPRVEVTQIRLGQLTQPASKGLLSPAGEKTSRLGVQTLAPTIPASPRALSRDSITPAPPLARRIDPLKTALNAKAGSVDSSSGVVRIQITPEKAEALKGNIMGIFRDPKIPFQQKAEQLSKLIASSNLPENEAFSKLLDAHKPMLDELRAKGWVPLKKELKNKMQTEADAGGITRETLRKEIVDNIVKTTQAVFKAMGIEDVGHHSNVGSAGWDSDIDTTFVAPQGMSNEMKTLYKFMFDAVAFNKLGGPSGDIIDTECYLEHAATVLKTQDNLSTAEGQQVNAYLEKCMTVFHKMQGMQHVHGEAWKNEWNTYKDAECDAIAKQRDTFSPDSEPYRVLDNYHKQTQKIFFEVEQFYETVVNEVGLQIMREGDPQVKGMDSSQFKKYRASWMAMDEKERQGFCQAILKDNPSVEKTARMSHKIEHLMKLTQQMDELGQELGKIPKGEQRDRILLEMKACACVLYTFFDEAIYSEGAIGKIVYSRTGQGVARAVDETLKNVQEAETQSKEHEPAGMTLREFQEQESKFKFNRSLKPKADSAFTVSEKHKQKSTPLDELAAQEESIAMYHEHFDKDAHASGELSTAVVKQSKYSERAMNATVNLLVDQKIKAMKDKPLQALFTAMLQDPTMRLQVVFAKEMERSPELRTLLQGAGNFSLESLWTQAEQASEATQVLEQMRKVMTDEASQKVLNSNLSPEKKLSSLKQIAKDIEAKQGNKKLSRAIRDSELRVSTGKKDPQVVISFIKQRAIAANPQMQKELDHAAQHPALTQFLQTVAERESFVFQAARKSHDPAFMLQQIDQATASEADRKEGDKLTLRCLDLFSATKELEKCKRGKQLNSLATVELLSTRATKLGANETMQARILELVGMEEPGGRFTVSQESLTPQKKLEFYQAILHNGGINAQDPEIVAILKVRAGFPIIVDGKEDKEMMGILKLGQEITLRKLNLTSEAEIAGFNRNLENCTRDVRVLCVQSKSVPGLPARTNLASLLERWEKTKR